MGYIGFGFKSLWTMVLTLGTFKFGFELCYNALEASACFFWMGLVRIMSIIVFSRVATASPAATFLLRGLAAMAYPWLL